MSNYTPGPWLYNSAGQIVMTNDGQMSVADIRGFGRLSSEHGDAKACEIMDANGLLVANAADMFEALRMIRCRLNNRDRNMAENETFHTANKVLVEIEKHGPIERLTSNER